MDKKKSNFGWGVLVGMAIVLIPPIIFCWPIPWILFLAFLNYLLTGDSGLH